MTLAKNSSAVLAILMALLGFAPSASAGPQDYCAAYARQIASSKTGLPADDVEGTLGSVVEQPAQTEPQASQSDAATASIDSLRGSMAGDPAAEEKWHKAYDQAFESCLDNYELQPLTATVDAAAKADTPELDKDQQKARVSSPPRRKAASSPRKTKASNTSRKAKAASPRKAKRHKSATRSSRTRTKSQAVASKSPRTVARSGVQRDPCAGKTRTLALCRQKKRAPTATVIKTETEPITKSGEPGTR